ncbi:GNAT family N-acetyltransferase [Ornithinimicrobium pekingense]|uniref:GNAT family N-acetyltransferase n=1 Tax=Ornithinimicrobium pekingense TaxID=384677 RepID=UPI0003B4A826|nr:GNAT family N-acetyltransferase [Ornithinimicrobium pekingense]
MTDDPRLIDLTPEDYPRIKDLDDTVWFEVVPGQTPEDLRDHLDLRHARALERTGEPLPGEAPTDRPPLVGIYSAYDMAVTVPGPRDTLTRVPIDGLTWVGIHPDHRRKGLLTRLMKDHLHRVHDRAECAVAGLHASEAAIYGRFGYGCSSLDVKLTLGRGAELTAPPAVAEAADGVQLHMVTLPTEQGMAALHEAHLASAATTLGAVTRPDAMALTWWRDYPKARGEKEKRRLLLARRDGRLTGYAALRRESKWDDATPQGTVQVVELAAADDPTLLALVRRLVSFDLTSKVTLWSRSVDDPVMWWAGGPRSVDLRAYDSLWLRLVDVPRALTERGYAAACDVVLEVEDALCPWNAGRWRLAVDTDGRATCASTDEVPDLTVPVALLGAAYGGGRSLASQVPTLGGTEHTPGAVRQLSRAMRADTEPYGAIGF